MHETSHSLFNAISNSSIDATTYFHVQSVSMHGTTHSFFNGLFISSIGATTYFHVHHSKNALCDSSIVYYFADMHHSSLFVGPATLTAVMIGFLYRRRNCCAGLES